MATGWVTTTTILQRLRDFDDDDAWNRLVERFRRPITRFARDLGVSQDLAEDAAQETLLDFARALRAGQYDPDRGRLSGWLFGIAYRRALKARGREGRDRDRFLQDNLDGIPDARSATTIWERRWRTHVLEECLRIAQREFSEETFRAFHLVVARHRSPAEAAQELGIPIKAVYNAKHRVLKRVRELSAAFEEAEATGHAMPGI